MPAKKWEIDIQEIMQWMIRGEQEFAQMVMDFDLKENEQQDPESQDANQFG